MSHSVRIFTADDIALCRSWRNAGVSWRRIADRLDTTPDLLRVAADPGYAERRLERRRLSDRLAKQRKAAVAPAAPPVDVVEAPAPEPVPTPSAHIIALHKRRVPLTGIAAIVRQPYRVVSDVISRHQEAAR